MKILKLLSPLLIALLLLFLLRTSLGCTVETGGILLPGDTSRHLSDPSYCYNQTSRLFVAFLNNYVVLLFIIGLILPIWEMLGKVLKFRRPSLLGLKLFFLMPFILVVSLYLIIGLYGKFFR